MTRRSWSLFAAMCVIWGIPYLLIRVAVRDFSPGTLVFVRTGLGALVLLPFAVRTRGLATVWRRWRALLAFTVVEVALPWLLLSDAERFLSSSLTGLLVAAVPLVGVVIARLSGTDDGGSGVGRWVGLLLGLVGVVLLLGLDVGAVRAWPLIEVLLVAVCYAVGPVIMASHLADLPSIPVVATALGLTTLGYLPYALTHWPSSIAANVAWSALGLGVVCTALAFVIFFALVGAIGPARATVITYVNPAVAVGLGVLLLGERFTVGIGLGFAFILLGSVLAARRGARADSVPGEAAVAQTVVSDATDSDLADDPHQPAVPAVDGGGRHSVAGDQSTRTNPPGVSKTAATRPVSPS